MDSKQPPHGLNCQCLTCKWDKYKNDQGPGWNWNWISQDYSSLLVGGVAGSLLTLIGIVLLKQWRQNAFGSLSSTTPSSKTISSSPMVLVNNATNVAHNIITADASVGILYIPCTAIYEIDLECNLLLEDLTEDTVVTISIVKNGLPTDGSAVLFSHELGLCSGHPLIASFHGFRLLKGEDYIQVFAILSDSNRKVPLTILNFDFSIKLAKVERDGG
jgi:hypothetical protein